MVTIWLRAWPSISESWRTERKGEDKEEVERLHQKVKKYEMKLAGSSSPAAPADPEEVEEQWFTDVSAAAVAARAEKRGRL